MTQADKPLHEMTDEELFQLWGSKASDILLVPRLKAEWQHRSLSAQREVARYQKDAAEAGRDSINSLVWTAWATVALAGVTSLAWITSLFVHR
ncbi:MAG TPA: hypothetical protein VHU18_05980 [Rhizomicrobium sp.]|jgi:hypothetical protein|nr:hypothetical protein [Rhizomicrobium sp.]